MQQASNRRAWILVAIAAMALAVLSCAEAGASSARACANPVLVRLVRMQSESMAAGSARHLLPASDRVSSSWSSGAALRGWAGALPVLFLGLLALPVLSAPVASPHTSRPHSAPLLPASFQRPPPFLLA